MDRNSLIGVGLIGTILIGWLYFSAPSKEDIARKQFVQDSIAQVQLKLAEKEAQAIAAEKKKADSLKANDTTQVVLANLSDSAKQVLEEKKLVENFRDFAPAAKGKEEIIVLENNLMKVHLSTKGGKINSVELKNYTRPNSKEPLVLFQNDSLKQSLLLNAYNNTIISTDSLYFVSEDKSKIASASAPAAAKLRLKTSKADSYIEYSYVLKDNSYNVDYDVTFVGMQNIISSNNSEVILDWNMKMPSQELHIEKEKQTSGIYYKTAGAEEDVDNLSLVASEDKSLPESQIKWVAFKQQFFTSALVANTQFNQGALLKTFVDKTDTKNVKTTIASLSFNYNKGATDKFGMKFFFGPNQYHILRDQNLGLEKTIPMGWWIFSYLNKWLVIPIFEMFKDSSMSMGWVILILTLIIKILLLPIAYKTYLSSAKMRLLKPEMDAIKEKHKGDAMKANQDNMALYKRAGVSPLSGCIPALLQLPILIALLNFFPASFELRQKAFLWASDLSTYDSVWDFGYVPVINTIYGDHMSMFALMMFVSTIVYTWMNQKMMPMQNSQMPGMQVMMYLMPVIFLSFMNSYSAGLSWYYFLANMITFLQTFIMRKMISDDKLRAQIDANMKKPAKKSGFQARLEEMQKKQLAARKK